MSQKRCPVCGSHKVSNFIDIPQMPIYCNRLWSTREGALAAPKGEIKLGYCVFCGHIFNLAFNPYLMEYDQEYENSLHFSPRFQAYAEALALRLIKDYDLYNKDVIEIGCGKGDFLSLLCDLGKNRGLGFDPSFENSRVEVNNETNFNVVKDFFSERYEKYPADLICCRHVLEHIQNPQEFLKGVRKAIGNRATTIVFFEVPDVMYTFRDLGIWDIIYEHCGYFNHNSLRYLFTACGFEILKLQSDFDGQFLCVEARPVGFNGVTDGLSDEEKRDLSNYINSFSEKYLNKINDWDTQLNQIKRLKEKTVIWGGGSKGVTFLNVLKNFETVKYVVDINPHKQGKFVPGTGQKIVDPKFLAEIKPEFIIIMNPNYLSEIKFLAGQLNLSSQFLIV